MRRIGILRMITRLMGWAAAALIGAMLITGYGISDFRVVEQATFGLLGKALSQRAHEWLGVPALVLLLLHIAGSVAARIAGRGKEAIE